MVKVFLVVGHFDIKRAQYKIVLAVCGTREDAVEYICQSNIQDCIGYEIQVREVI